VESYDSADFSIISIALLQFSLHVSDHYSYTKTQWQRQPNRS